MKNNDMKDEIFGEEFHEQFLPENMKLPKERTNRVFIAIAVGMILLFLLGLGAVLFLVTKTDAIQVFKSPAKPYYSGPHLVFPPGTDDWKFSYNYQGDPIFYCHINEEWYKCVPDGVE
jgi:hypothetical protein